MPDEETNPWQTLSSDLRYDNAWISVTHREVIKPSGEQGIYGVVHYKNLALGIVPVDAEGNTWLVGQYRYPTDRYSWEIPEGGGKIGVEPLASAQRELREETGIEAAKWRELLHFQVSNSVSDELAYVFLATDLSHGEPEPEDTEQLTIRKLPLTEAIDMALDGRIADAISIAALLRVKVELDNGTLFG
jgi:8-oxo-dGTP pyrophosphatase MutT (NUDIX family)